MEIERAVVDSYTAIIRYSGCYQGKNPRGNGHASRQTEVAVGGTYYVHCYTQNKLKQRCTLQRRVMHSQAHMTNKGPLFSEYLMFFFNLGSVTLNSSCILVTEIAITSSSSV